MCLSCTVHLYCCVNVRCANGQHNRVNKSNLVVVIGVSIRPHFHLLPPWYHPSSAGNFSYAMHIGCSMSVNSRLCPVNRSQSSIYCSRASVRGSRRCWRAALSQQQAVPSACDELHLQYDTLASLVTPDTHCVRLGYTDLGRGLVAQQDCSAGTQCISVDAFNLLCVTDEPLRTGNAFGSAALADWQLLHSELPPILASYLLSRRGDWFKRLVAWLLWLKRHGHGVWQMYMQLMPTESEMASLMNFTPEERHELQSSEMEALAEQERTAIQGLHDSIFSSQTGDLASLDLAPEFQDTLWAACMVNSRCFSDAVGREAVSLLVPCADMANHSMTPNAGYRLDPETQTFNITTTEAVAAGQEVLISYLGEKPSKNNTQLMKDYGFVLPGNLNDQIQLKQTSVMQPQLKASRLLEAAAQQPCHSSDPQAVAAHKRRQQVVLKSLQPFVDLGSSSNSGSAWVVASGTPGMSLEQQQALELEQQCRQPLDR
eukprot:GHUV01040088.1.p1 GENE.GHUV01040088.1~~GHUV01040088.1.p1  ORF type:complete len:486 (+),score=115.66 GHUV01040088.1:144-1601(+)